MKSAHRLRRMKTHVFIAPETKLNTQKKIDVVVKVDKDKNELKEKIILDL